MAKKDPVRGMQPMDEYTRVRGSDIANQSKMDKALDVAGSGLALAGVSSIPIYAAKRISDAKKKTEQEKPQKSGMELEIENARKDRRVKEEYEAYEKSKGMKKGGKVKSASARADGIAIRGKTRA
jgi:hypothetical protein